MIEALVSGAESFCQSVSPYIRAATYDPKTLGLKYADGVELIKLSRLNRIKINRNKGKRYFHWDASYGVVFLDFSPVFRRIKYVSEDNALIDNASRYLSDYTEADIVSSILSRDVARDVASPFIVSGFEIFEANLNTLVRYDKAAKAVTEYWHTARSHHSHSVNLSHNDTICMHSPDFIGLWNIDIAYSICHSALVYMQNLINMSFRYSNKVRSYPDDDYCRQQHAKIGCELDECLTEVYAYYMSLLYLKDIATLKNEIDFIIGCIVATIHYFWDTRGKFKDSYGYYDFISLLYIQRILERVRAPYGRPLAR